MLSLLPVAGVSAKWITALHFTLCPWQTLTDHPCIFCGLTRALASAMAGDLEAATAWHPLWPLALVGVLFLGITMIVDGVGERDDCGHFARILGAQFWSLWVLLSLGTALRW